MVEYSTTTSAPPTRERQRQRKMTGHRDGGNWQLVDVSRGFVFARSYQKMGRGAAVRVEWTDWNRDFRVHMALIMCVGFLLFKSASRRSEGGRVQGEREIAAVGVRKNYRAPRPKEIGREGFTLEGCTGLIRSGASRTEHSTDRSVGGVAQSAWALRWPGYTLWCASGVPLVWVAGMADDQWLSRTTSQKRGAASTDTGSSRRCQESGHDHSLYHLGKLVMINVKPATPTEKLFRNQGGERKTWPYPHDEAFPPVDGSHDMFYGRQTHGRAQAAGS
ncbi:hypothetical protein BDZ85DRAFT_253457 [Elsinoe ampelina]|uniref:Uncharacterized protein n=1 Tax=Elsinoe ampelina TaxID=302913 RepID=A0A6A6FYP1_9PEZI|nr:hypothetical protein BDZ85DRAFT_253457 [Elsinoe ampelina]